MENMTWPSVMWSMQPVMGTRCLPAKTHDEWTPVWWGTLCLTPAGSNSKRCQKHRKLHSRWARTCILVDSGNSSHSRGSATNAVVPVSDPKTCLLAGIHQTSSLTLLHRFWMKSCRFIHEFKDHSGLLSLRASMVKIFKNKDRKSLEKV